MLTVSALAVMTRAACADSYTGPTVTGGSSTNMGKCASWTGPTDTFTWSGTSSPPQSVIVEQSASASAGALDQNYMTAGPAMAACTDGLGDTPTITPTYPQTPSNSESLSGSASRTVYKVQGGAATITLTSKASASASDPPNQTVVSANGSYDAQVFPVAISIGGAKQDSSGNYDILVGQRCAPTVGGGPDGGSYSNVNWTVSGTTFQSWSDTTSVPANPQASFYADGSGNLNTLTPSWYWNDDKNTSETVSCTATYIAPDGTSLSVKAMQKVTVYVPGFSASGTPGTMQVNTGAPNEQGGICLYAGPAIGKTGGGMNFSLLVATPQTPIAFGTGKLQLVQLWAPNMTYMTTDSPPATHSDIRALGLDTSYPNFSAAEGTMPSMPSDSPTLPLQDWIFSARMTSSFTDYLMYVAPGSTQPVPLATFGWSTDGSATKPFSGGWAAFGTGSAGTVDLTNGSTFSA